MWITGNRLLIATKKRDRVKLSRFEFSKVLELFSSCKGSVFRQPLRRDADELYKRALALAKEPQQ